MHQPAVETPREAVKTAKFAVFPTSSYPRPAQCPAAAMYMQAANAPHKYATGFIVRHAFPDWWQCG